MSKTKSLARMKTALNINTSGIPTMKTSEGAGHLWCVTTASLEHLADGLDALRGES